LTMTSTMTTRRMRGDPTQAVAARVHFFGSP